MSDRVGEGQAGKYCGNFTRGCTVEGQHNQCEYVSMFEPSSPSPKPETPLTCAEINALPIRVRDWIMDLETRADPAGDLRALRLAQDENAMLRKRLEPSAPKPEMLEKADPTPMELEEMYGAAVSLQWGRDLDAGGWIVRLVKEVRRLREALRASEAAVESLRKSLSAINCELGDRIRAEQDQVESLRKERDRAIQERDHYCDRLGNEEQDHGNTKAALVIAQSRETLARAEATKAETLVREWHLKLCTCGGARSWPNGTYAASCLACGKMNAAIRAPRPPGETTPCRSCNGRGYFDVIQVPSSPTPPTSPPTELQERYARMGDAAWFKETHDGKSLGDAIPVSAEPTPPSEEPRPSGTIKSTASEQPDGKTR